MKKMVSIVLCIALLFSISFAEQLNTIRLPYVYQGSYELFTPDTKEVTLPSSYLFTPYFALDEYSAPLDVDIKSTKDTVIHVVEETGNLFTLNEGTATLKFTTKDETPKTYQVKIVIPNVYVSHEKYTFETLEPLLFSYEYTYASIQIVESQGSSVDFHHIDYDRTIHPTKMFYIQMMEVTPVKPGKTTLLLKQYDGPTKKVVFTVPESLFEE